MKNLLINTKEFLSALRYAMEGTSRDKYKENLSRIFIRGDLVFGTDAHIITATHINPVEKSTEFCSAFERDIAKEIIKRFKMQDHLQIYYNDNTTIVRNNAIEFQFPTCNAYIIDPWDFIYTEEKIKSESSIFNISKEQLGNMADEMKERMRVEKKPTPKCSEYFSHGGVLLVHNNETELSIHCKYLKILAKNFEGEAITMYYKGTRAVHIYEGDRITLIMPIIN
jgi:hypothetical protein